LYKRSICNNEKTANLWISDVEEINTHEELVGVDVVLVSDKLLKNLDSTHAGA